MESPRGSYAARAPGKILVCVIYPILYLSVSTHVKCVPTRLHPINQRTARHNKIIIRRKHLLLVLPRDSTCYHTGIVNYSEIKRSLYVYLRCKRPTYKISIELF